MLVREEEGLIGCGEKESEGIRLQGDNVVDAHASFSGESEYVRHQLAMRSNPYIEGDV
jgi:hypothetical protein